MPNATLEHVNITVTDPKATAAMLSRIFGWHTRWEGPSMNDGYTVHVGSETSYLALYSEGTPDKSKARSYLTRAGLNHIALVVDDLEAVEDRVRAEGFKPNSYGDYEPGRRFYFTDGDDVEYEVVSYLAALSKIGLQNSDSAKPTAQKPDLQKSSSQKSATLNKVRAFKNSIMKELGAISLNGAIMK